MPPLQFIVDRRESGQTLASVIKKRFGISWAQAKRLVENRHVRLGQQIEADPARRVKPGKRVLLDAGTIESREKPASKHQAHPKDASRGKAHGGKADLGASKKALANSRGKVKSKTPAPRKPQPPRNRLESQAPDLTSDSIVYLDDAVVVVNKPAGLTTMRHKEEAAEFGRGQRFLPATLADRLPTLLGDSHRNVIAVHRIDRDTSGLVVFARSPAAAQALLRQFRNHTVDRRYLALTRGLPSSSSMESVLVRDRGDGRRGSTRRTAATDGKRAITHVHVVEELGDFAAVECRLETGRTHQVRIHLGEAGAPLCGERVYDRPINGRPPPDGSGAKRPMLHAARLGFQHPTTGETMTWEAKPPPDFAAIWSRMRDS